ncbi:MAG TPA: permease [Pyrinomonadaceae bacterium]|nr:permease [Pyrinomonadaceae bacterium]
MQSNEVASAESSSNLTAEIKNRSTVIAFLLLLTIAGALITYKTTAALAVVQKIQNTGTLQPRSGVFPLPGNSSQLNAFERSINYFLIVGPALIFGILISGTVRVLISPQLWSRLIGVGSFRPQLIAGAAGVPLMLCSCCAAPIFSSMYERSSRVGPSLATVLAAPSLNPFALLLTFMLFGPRVGIVRVTIAILIVFLTATLVERLFSTKLKACPVQREEADQPTATALLQSWLRVAVRTVPLIVAGVLISMFLARWLPIGAFDSTTARVVAVIAIALIAVPLAMPTFFEIPLALILLSAGAPTAAAVAMLIAGPAINLPSLLTIGHATNWKVAGTVALSVFLLAFAGGLLVNIL